MTADRETLAVYAAQTARYAAIGATPDQKAALAGFLARIPDGGRILDIGCGPGAHAKAMQDKGYTVTAWDASPEFVDVARTNGVDAYRATFDDLKETDAFEGIWASFSLLHTPKSEHARHITAMAQALRPGGHLFIGMKQGEGEARDDLGRFYAYVTQAELETMCSAAGLHPVDVVEGMGKSLAGGIDAYILLTCRRDA